MNDLLLRPEQDTKVLIAANDPVQKVEVRRVNDSDRGRVIDPDAVYAMQMRQQAAYQAQMAQQQASVGRGFQWGAGSSVYMPMSPLAAALGGIR